jgi:PKD repeat protein
MKNFLLLTLLFTSGIFVKGETALSDCDADFSFTVDGMTVYFTDMSTSDDGPIVSWFWEFGDGTTSAEMNPVHTYAEPGEYDVCLTIVADGGCEDDRCESNIPVMEGGGLTCDAAFEYEGPELTISFFDASEADAAIVGYSWDFDDGTTSTEENPVHTFPAPGVYEVCLTIETEGFGEACISTTCQTVIVGGVGLDCWAAFDFEIDGTTIYFETATDPGPGDVISYFWDFGDGTTGTEENPVHEYEPGVYEVCLTVVFYDSCFAEYCDDLLIDAGGDCVVTAEVVGEDGLSQHFYAAVDPDFDEITYTWTFGDGTTFTETTAGTPPIPGMHMMSRAPTLFVL